MRSIATLQTPTSGPDPLRRHRRRGQDPEALRRTLGYLPQDFGVYPRVSAYDMLDHMAVLKGIAERPRAQGRGRAAAGADQPLAVRKKALAGFSGGMRQRFGIAQALIGEPRLIIVDEPTAGLDPEERNRFLNLLAEIGENVVVILSTHIVEDVADLCPPMAVIAGGRIVRKGAPGELIAELQGRVWTKTIDKAELAALRERYDVISTRLFAGRTVVHVLSDTDPGDGFRRTGAGWRTSTSPPCTPPARRAAADGGPRHVPQDRRLRAPLPAEEPGVLGRARSSSSCWPSAAWPSTTFVSSGGRQRAQVNSPLAIVDRRRILCRSSYMFVTTAFVANVVTRDDETGFGPILRTTRVTKFDYLYGRFPGAFAAAALAFCSIPLACWSAR